MKKYYATIPCNIEGKRYGRGDIVWTSKKINHLVPFDSNDIVSMQKPKPKTVRMQYKILTQRHIDFDARLLNETINTLGYPCEIVDSIDIYDDSIYIIYCANTVKVLPANYIVYQVEVFSSKWFTPRYLETIKGALCVWEYDRMNATSYKGYNQNVFIVPPGIKRQPVVEKDIDILFYGSMNSKRQHILAELGNEFNITVANGYFGKDMWDMLARAKTVLNIHFYESVRGKYPLETFRVNEALSFGCDVVSEGPAHADYPISWASSIEGYAKALRNPARVTDFAGLDNKSLVKAALEGTKKLLPAYLNGRVAVYTAVYGDYEEVREHVRIPGVDYVLFTDNASLKSDFWDVRYVLRGQGETPAMAYKKVKCLSHEYLSEYDYTVWLDGNFTITNPDFLGQIWDYFENGKILVYKHVCTSGNVRDCVYVEAAHSMPIPKYREEKLEEQVRDYKKAGYPEHTGLYQSGFLLRDNRDKKVIAFNKHWMAEIKKYGVKTPQCQVSLPFSLRASGAIVDIIEDRTMFDGSFFKMFSHK